MLVPVGAGERALGALLAEDVVLLGGQLARQSASDFVIFSVVMEEAYAVVSSRA